MWCFLRISGDDWFHESQTCKFIKKKLRFVLSDKSDFHMISNLSIAITALASCMLMSFSVEETLIQRYVNLSTSFREPPFSVEMSIFRLKHVYSDLSAFAWRPMPLAACSRLGCRRVKGEEAKKKMKQKEEFVS